MNLTQLIQFVIIQQVQMKSWRGKSIIGAAAGRYHSVFFTQNEVYSCGLNAGQLGHPKGEHYQVLPRQVCIPHSHIHHWQ